MGAKPRHKIAIANCLQLYSELRFNLLKGNLNSRNLHLNEIAVNNIPPVIFHALRRTQPKSNFTLGVPNNLSRGWCIYVLPNSSRELKDFKPCQRWDSALLPHRRNWDDTSDAELAEAEFTTLVTFSGETSFKSRGSLPHVTGKQLRRPVQLCLSIWSHIPLTLGRPHHPKSLSHSTGNHSSVGFRRVRARKLL